MGIIFKRPQVRQPQGVVQLDQSNPLAEAPGFLWVASRNGRDVVSNIPAAKSGSTPPTIVGSPAGVAGKFTSGAATVSYLDLGTPAGASVGLGITATTFVGVFYANSTSGVAIADRNDANSVDAGWMFGNVNNSFGVYGLGIVKEYSGTNLRVNITNTVSTGLNVLVITLDGSGTQSGTRIFLNGIEGTYNTGSSFAGTPGSDASRNLYIGRNSFDTPHSHDGLILMAGAFRRQWAVPEILSFSRNPWQLFRSPSRQIYLPTTATGATTATAADGVATVSATAASTATTTGAAAAGTATVSRTAASTAASTGSSAAGVATVSGTAASGAATTGTTAAGVATVSSVGASTAVTTATAAVGAATVSATSSGAIATASAATGTATVSATVSSTASTTGSAASGAASVSATTGSSSAATASSANGTATVSGTTASEAATTATSADGAATVSATAIGLTAGETTAVPAAGISTASAIASAVAAFGVIAAVGTATVSASTGGETDYEAIAAAVWSYTLSNGKTAEQTVLELHEMLETLNAAPNLDTPIEGAFSSADLLRIIAAVAAGKTSIESASPGTATVEFRDVNDAETRVSADMVGSERASVTINPS